MARLHRIVLAALALTCGCSGTPGRLASVATPLVATGPREVVTSDGQFVAAYRPEPDPLPFNETFDMTVQVTAAPGCSADLDGCRIQVTAWMPEHNHGMTRTPVVRQVGPATFLLEGLLLHMPGYWEIVVNVFAGATSGRAVFPVMIE